MRRPVPEREAPLAERGGTLRPGEVLNNTYVIEELVGSGGTGEVYRARNRATGREMAIKILRREFAGNEAFINLMRREASVLHEVVDDAVVRYHDLLESELHGGFVFLVMEFIRGESLADMMARGPVDEGTLLTIARRVAQGLAAAHGKNAFHRDLSPDNIILREADPARTVVIDFGIAKDVSADARTVIGGGFAGKYQYAAPEQMDGNVDGRSDLYSLGMTLIAAFRGETPQVGTSFLEVLRVKSQKPDISDLPGLLHDLVDRLVEPDPARRFQSAAEVVAFLGGGLPAGRPRTALTDPGAAREPTRPGPRSTVPIEAAPPARKGGGAGLWIGLVLLLALVGGGGWFFLAGPGREMLFGPEFPRADPYRFEIAVPGPGTMRIEGNAPNPEAAAAFLAALSNINEGRTPEGRITPATGMPGPGWQPGIVAMARAAAALPAWSISVTGTEARLRGEAPTPAARDSVLAAARVAAREGGLALVEEVTLAPQPLDLAKLRAEINAFATCGALSVVGGDGRSVPPGATVTVGGVVSQESDRLLLENAVKPLLEGRPLDLRLGVINPTICRVLGLLPEESDPRLRLVFAHGGKPGLAEDGVFHKDEEPVISLELPADLAGYVHVLFADVEGSIYNFLPHNHRPEHRIEAIGEVRDGVRSIPVTWPVKDEAIERIAFTIAEPFGITMVVAVVTPAPLFPEVLPVGVSVEAFLPQFQAALAAQKGREIIGFRFLVARP